MAKVNQIKKNFDTKKSKKHTDEVQVSLMLSVQWSGTDWPLFENAAAFIGNYFLFKPNYS